MLLSLLVSAACRHFLFTIEAGCLTGVFVVAARQPQELLAILSFWWSSVCHMQFPSEDVAFLVLGLGRSLEIFNCIDPCVLLLILTLFHRSSIPRSSLFVALAPK